MIPEHIPVAPEHLQAGIQDALGSLAKDSQAGLDNLEAHRRVAAAHRGVRSLLEHHTLAELHTAVACLEAL